MILCLGLPTWATRSRVVYSRTLDEMSLHKDLLYLTHNVQVNLDMATLCSIGYFPVRLVYEYDYAREQFLTNKIIVFQGL